MSSLETEKALAERFLVAAFEGDDRRTVRRMLAPAFVAHDPAVAEPRAGPEAFEHAVLDDLHDAFPDLSLAIEELVAEGDDVVCRFTLTGTHERAFRGLEPTGESVVLTGVAQLRLSNEGVTDLWLSLDSVDLLAQLGVLEDDRSRGGWPDSADTGV